MCELLEYIIIGWPNHPGRPELLSSETRTDGFNMSLKLYPPDHLGGLDITKLEFDVFCTGAEFNDKPNFIETVRAKNPSSPIISTLLLTSKVRMLGLSSLRNTYFIHVQLSVTDVRMVGIAALPNGSPHLVILAICDLVGQ